MQKYWRQHPPVHRLVAAYLDYTPNSDRDDVEGRDVGDVAMGVAAVTGQSSQKLSPMLSAEQFKEMMTRSNE